MDLILWARKRRHFWFVGRYRMEDAVKFLSWEIQNWNYSCSWNSSSWWSSMRWKEWSSWSPDLVPKWMLLWPFPGRVWESSWGREFVKYLLACNGYFRAMSARALVCQSLWCSRWWACGTFCKVMFQLCFLYNSSDYWWDIPPKKIVIALSPLC